LTRLARSSTLARNSSLRSIVSAGNGMTPEAFIEHWRDRGGLERANYQTFVNELCDLIGAPRPEPAFTDDARNDYVFERRVRALDIDGEDWRNNYVDCYRRDHFVLEAKQSNKRLRGEAALATLDLFGAASAKPATRPAWDKLMRQAREQAERYAKFLPREHGWPPFLIVVDVGHMIEVFADFDRSGKGYVPFPDNRSFRIALDDLAKEGVRDFLRAVWTDPRSLDPAARRAAVTRDIARRLALLARSLEKRFAPKTVAMFLMRCLFSAFAEDVGLLPAGSFVGVLRRALPSPAFLPRYLTPLWRGMDKGAEFVTEIDAKVAHFNGGLFREADALALTEDELRELILACERDWKDVEPAIFGTLLENALDSNERGRLGAHFTPRAHVERLVGPTIIEPLREDWRLVQVAAEAARLKSGEAEAIREIKSFHEHLCSIRVLDPACGTGNFLYVALEGMKVLEGEVIRALEDLTGESQGYLELSGISVGPAQFLGLEKNPRAVPVAELVMWIGHLQARIRQDESRKPPEPYLRAYDTIREADAILAWEAEELVRDETGKPTSRWDGRTTRIDTLTGREVPDEAARVEVRHLVKPRPAEWPEADYIIGNPPFIGGKDLRAELGDGYAEALWATHPKMPGGADFVMYWWDKAAELVRTGKARRFGFITTNSLTQTFSRRVVQRHLTAKPPLHLTFAIPDHPWADGDGAAAVRVAMTVGAPGTGEGMLREVTREGSEGDRDGVVAVELSKRLGVINADLTVGADVASAEPLRANEGLSSPGVKLHGSGFIVTPAEARGLGLGTVPGLERHIRHYRNGRDLTGNSRNVMVIDLFGLSESVVRREFPAVYQWVLDRVKQEREENSRESYRNSWWIFGEPRTDLRKFSQGLARYIATVETAKHRVFRYLDASILPDNKLVAIGLDDPALLGVLSSRIHVAWALAAGGWIGYGNDPVYVKTRCFDAFPFPDADPDQRRVIGELAEELDAHRKRVLGAHPKELTLTGLYNVLEKRRARADLSDAERDVYDLGGVGLMLDLHQRIDRATAEAYGWPADLPDTDILSRLVTLNHERRREEAEGLVRWLRPDYQNPTGLRGQAQLESALVLPESVVAKTPWPKDTRARARALVSVLRASPKGETAEAAARRFKGARRDVVAELLDLLVDMGQARRVGLDRYAA